MVNEVPQLTIVAGPNGAGKSTFVEDYLQRHPVRFLGADDIAAKLSPGRPDAVKISAGKMFSREVTQALRAGESLVVESTLSGRVFQRSVALAKELGFQIQILFVFLESPDACVYRVRERVRHGGHDVPEEDIHRRFYRSHRNFWEVYRPLVDSWYLYYNSSTEFVPVAFRDSVGQEIAEEALFQIFQRNVKGSNHG